MESTAALVLEPPIPLQEKVRQLLADSPGLSVREERRWFGAADFHVTGPQEDVERVKGIVSEMERDYVSRDAW